MIGLADSRTKPFEPTLQAGHPLARGLLGAWEFADRTGGTVRDSTSFHYDGTTGGSPTWTQSPFGPAMTFASSKYVTLGGILSGQSIGTSLSVSALVKWNGTTGSAMRIFKRGGEMSGREQYCLLANSSAYPQVTIFYADGPYVTHAIAASAIVANTWYSMVGVRDHLALRIYVNGVLAGSATTSADTWSSANEADCFISRFNSTYEQNWLGDIASVRVHGRALESGEIAEQHADWWGLVRPRRLAVLIGGGAAAAPAVPSERVGRYRCRNVNLWGWGPNRRMA